MTTYYIASTGSDAANGTSELTPWLHHPWDTSATGVSAGTVLSANDQTLFKRGDTFNNTQLTIDEGGSGVGNEVIVGSYGTGANPFLVNDDSYVVFAGSVGDSNVIFDNLDMLGTFGTGTVIVTSGSLNIQILNGDIDNTIGFGIAFSAASTGTVRNVTAGGANVSLRVDSSSLVVSDIDLSGFTEQGLYIKDVTGSFTGSNIDITAIGPPTKPALLIENSINVDIVGGTVFESPAQGVSIISSSSAVVIDGYEVQNVNADAYFIDSGSTDITIVRSKASYAGNILNVSFGDAFTSHDSCTDIKLYYNFSTNNFNTAHAHVGTSSGVIAQHTSYNDGGAENMTRASLYLTGTGAWTVKNSIFNVVDGYNVAECGAAPALTLDYNAYISNSATSFKINGVGGKTFNEWIVAVGNETNSYFIHKNGSVYDWYKGDDPGTKIQTTSYNPVTSAGKLVSSPSNLLLNTGLVIPGVNDGGELDIWGNVTDATPNIGAYQGPGEAGLIFFGSKRFGNARYGGSRFGR